MGPLFISWVSWSRQDLSEQLIVKVLMLAQYLLDRNKLSIALCGFLILGFGYLLLEARLGL